MPLEDGSFVIGGTVSQEYKASYVEEPVLILSFVRVQVSRSYSSAWPITISRFRPVAQTSTSDLNTSEMVAT